MSSTAIIINRFLEQHNSTLRVSFLKDVDDYSCFDVHGHSILPGVDECRHVSTVQLNEQSCAYASAAPWKCGYHGTSVSNLLLILSTCGFSNKRSGDTPAGICLAPKFHAAGSYNRGAVLQCDVHGFQHPLHPHKVKEYVRWAGEYVPIGMNTKQKKGTPLGQLMSRPGNLCIKKIYLGKSIDVAQILSRSLQATTGACYAGFSDPLTTLENTLSSRAAVCSVKDLRVQTQAASSSTQLPLHSSSVSADANPELESHDVVLKPVSLKTDLGDQRFHWNKKHGRQHVCDACCELFQYQSQAHPFDGQYLVKLPGDKSPRTLETMYWQGEHDFTWVCTFCQYESSDYTDIDEFRRYLGIDFTQQRQKRTATNPHKFGRRQ